MKVVNVMLMLVLMVALFGCSNMDAGSSSANSVEHEAINANIQTVIQNQEAMNGNLKTILDNQVKMENNMEKVCGCAK